MPRKKKVYRQATRDVRLSNKPALQAIKRESKRGANEYADYMGAADWAYKGLINELQGLNPQYNQISNNIADSLNAQLGELAGLLGTANPANAPEGSPEGIAYGTPAGEAAAAAGLYGTLGAGGLELLGSQRQRNLGYTTSAKRQGAIERETAQTNLIQDYQDFQQEMRDRRLGITSTMPLEIRQRIDQIKQQNLQNRIAREQLAIAKQEAESNAAMAEMMMANISGLLTPPPTRDTGVDAGTDAGTTNPYPSTALTEDREGGTTETPTLSTLNGGTRTARIIELYRKYVGQPPIGPYTRQQLRGMLQAARRARENRTYLNPYTPSDSYPWGTNDTPEVGLQLNPYLPWGPNVYYPDPDEPLYGG